MFNPTGISSVEQFPGIAIPMLGSSLRPPEGQGRAGRISEVRILADSALSTITSFSQAALYHKSSLLRVVPREPWKIRQRDPQLPASPRQFLPLYPIDAMCNNEQGGTHVTPQVRADAARGWVI